MERKEYQSKQILPGISVLYGVREECCIYVVEGDEKVALALLKRLERLTGPP